MGRSDQVGVAEAVLGSYRRLAGARVEKDRESPLRGQLEARWAIRVSHAQGIVDGSHRGQVGYAFEGRAAQDVLSQRGL